MARGAMQPVVWPKAEVPQAFCSGLTVEETLENQLLAKTPAKAKDCGETSREGASNTICLFCSRPVVLARERQLSIAEALVAKGASPEPAGELAGLFTCARCPRAMHAECHARWSCCQRASHLDGLCPASRSDLCPQHDCQLCAERDADALLVCVSCPFAACFKCVDEETAGSPWEDFAWMGWVDGPFGPSRVRCPSCAKL